MKLGDITTIIDKPDLYVGYSASASRMITIKNDARKITFDEFLEIGIAIPDKMRKEMFSTKNNNLDTKTTPDNLVS